MKDAQQLVVTGSSAGGIEALSTLLASLPADFPAAIVVAQHLDPNTHSILGQILSKHSTLPVRIVERKESLTPGTVFVVPSNRHASITDHEVLVSEEGPKGVKPSVDLLFSTASVVFGERLIAVILSGMGSDGIVGARMVKKNGGTVIIQDPDTAMFPSMPLSLPKTSVDFTSKVEAIGPLLDDLLKGTYLPHDDDKETSVKSLLDQVREISGVDFSNYKMPTILRRLSRLMAAAGCDTIAQYSNYLRRNPEAYQRLISAFLIRVTEFFRDADLFDYLRQTVMPEIIATAKENDRDVRMWSAGCATGEEAYSLAIVLAELLGDGSHNARIFATDLDNEAVSFARRGVYSADVLEDVPANLLEKYFTRVDSAYEVSKRIRALVVFGQHDLGQRAPFPHLDLVLCRNVLIYFTKDLQQRTLHLFAYSLRPGGFLALGKSETSMPLTEYFEPSNTSLKVYKRRSERVPLIIGSARPEYTPPRPIQTLPPLRLPPMSGIDRPHHTALSDDIGSLLIRSPLGVVIVDRRYDIQAINNAAREFLSIRTIGIGEDLIHLISPAHGIEIRKGIDGAFRNERPPQAGIELEVTSDAGEQRDIRIMCYPGRNPDGGLVDAVILLVTDITETHATRKKTETELAALRSQIERMVAEKQELVERQKSLIDANSELTKANVELLANNERLVISVEEAQSATEEIETLNEEMQATNEELETVNEELQATVEELNTTNDELEARTMELQDLAITREAQRQASETTREDLAVALNLVEDAVAALDPTGIVLFANEAYRRLEAAAASGKGTFLLGERPAQLAEIALASTSGQPSDVGFRMNGPEQSTGAYRVTTWTNSRNGDQRTAILRIRRTDG